MKPQIQPIQSASLTADPFARISVRYSKNGRDYRGVVLTCPAQKMTTRFKSGRMIDDLDASLALCRHFNWRPEPTQSVIRYVPIRDLHERGLVAIEFMSKRSVQQEKRDERSDSKLSIQRCVR